MKAHLFNPTCEMEVANGEVSYTPPTHLRRMTQDLEVLPAYYANAQDAVIVQTKPSSDLIARWKSAGFCFDNFKYLSEDLTAYKPQAWGWSPSVARQLAHLGASWNNALKPYYHRSFAADVLGALKKRPLLRLVSDDDLPVSLDKLSDVENLLAKRGKVVIKAPLSSSGRGIQILRNHHLDINIYNKTKSIIKQQGAVMLEPLLDKLADFAFEFFVENEEISFVGYSFFVVNDKGQYDYHHFPFSPDLFPAEGRQLWDCGVIHSAKEELQDVLQQSGLCQLYSGYLGVDAMIFRNAQQEVLLQPCVEINLRYNMGIVALHLEKHIVVGSIAEFRLEAKQDISFRYFDIEMQRKYPLHTTDGQINEGYLPLTLPTEEAQFMAYILVFRE